MGYLDEVKHKVGEFGDKAGDAFEAAKDKAGNLVETVKEKLDTNDDGTLSTADATVVIDDAKEKASGLLDDAQDKLDRDADGTLSAADASAAFESARAQAGEVFDNLKGRVAEVGEAPADAVAEAAGGTGAMPDEAPDFPEEPATDATASANIARDDALAAVQGTAEDLKSDRL